MFTFKWYDYGPMSWELEQIRAGLVYAGRVTVTKTETKKPGAYTQNMTFNSDSKLAEFFYETRFTDEIVQKTDEIVSFIRGRTPRNLELLASVHYLAKHQNPTQSTYTAEDIHTMLENLKPNAGFTLEDVNGAIKTLKEHMYLTD